MPLYEFFLVARPVLTKKEVFDVIKYYADVVIKTDGIITGIKYYGLQDLIRRMGNRVHQDRSDQAHMMMLKFLSRPAATQKLVGLANEDYRLYRRQVYQQPLAMKQLDKELLEQYAKLMLLQEDARKGVAYAGHTKEAAQKVLQQIPDVDMDDYEVRDRIGLFGESLAPRMLRKACGMFEDDKAYVEWNRTL